MKPWRNGARNTASISRCTFNTRIWLKNIFTLSFGESFKDSQPVWGKIAERLPVTLKLNFWSLLVVYLVAIPLGIYSATHPNSFGDQMTTLIAFVLFAVPLVWAATMALGVYLRRRFLLFLSARRPGVAGCCRKIGLGGASSPTMRGICFCRWCCFPMTVSPGCRVTCVRACSKSCAKIMSKWRAPKGLDEGVVVFKHVLRNSLIPQVTLLASILPGLIGGSVIIETIFSIPGLGQLGFESVLSRDYPVVLALLAVTSILTLIGILISDLAVGCGRSANRLRPPGAMSQSPDMASTNSTTLETATETS